MAMCLLWDLRDAGFVPREEEEEEEEGAADAAAVEEESEAMPSPARAPKGKKRGGEAGEAVLLPQEPAPAKKKRKGRK